MAIEIDQVFININQHQYRGSIPILNNKYWYCDMPNRDRDAATDSDRVLLAHDRRTHWTSFHIQIVAQILCDFSRWRIAMIQQLSGFD